MLDVEEFAGLQLPEELRFGCPNVEGRWSSRDASRGGRGIAQLGDSVRTRDGLADELVSVGSWPVNDSMAWG